MVPYMNTLTILSKIKTLLQALLIFKQNFLLKEKPKKLWKFNLETNDAD